MEGMFQCVVSVRGMWRPLITSLFTAVSPTPTVLGLSFCLNLLWQFVSLLRVDRWLSESLVGMLLKGKAKVLWNCTGGALLWLNMQREKPKDFLKTTRFFTRPLGFLLFYSLNKYIISYRKRIV